MNVRILIGSLMLASLAVGLGRAAEQRPLANFKISVAVNPQKNEVALKRQRRMCLDRPDVLMQRKRRVFVAHRRVRYDE